MSKIIEILKKNIRASGSISLKEYMSIVLYHPTTGYYSKKNIIGKSGDFITAPEISQVFGELIAIWLIYNKKKFFKKFFNYIELGPGKGTLCKDIFRTVKKLDNDLYKKIKEIYFFEKSHTLKRIQYKNINPVFISTLDEVETSPMFVIANEFFDAIPVNQYIKKNNVWYEKRVCITNNKFTFTNSERIKNLNIPFPTNASNNCIFEYSEYSHYLILDICNRIRKFGGVFVIIDYAKNNNDYSSTLMSIFRHKYVTPFSFPGETDLSIKPDYNFYKKIAKKQGCKVLGPFSQGYFLKKLGIEERIKSLIKKNTSQKYDLNLQKERLINKNYMGESFKVMIIMNETLTDLIFENE